MNFFAIRNPLRIRHEVASKVSIILFYISFFMYIIASMLRDTTIKYTNPGCYALLLHFYWIPVIIAAINILLFTDYSVGQIGIYIVFALVFWISYKRYGNYRLYHSFLILLSAKHVKWEQCVKRTLYLYGLLILLIFFAYCFDALYSVDIYTRGDAVRWTLGYVHPNLLGGYLMVLAMLWATVRYGTFNVFDAVMMLLLAAFTWIGPASRTSAVIIGIVLLIVLMSKIIGNWLLNNPVTRFCMIYVFPICFLFIFGCSYLYDENNPFFIKLNEVLSGRVCFGYLFLKKYYHTWFGQKIKQVNNRTALLTGKQTMYLDSSYMRLYVGVGIVGCLITLWIFTRIMRYAVEQARWDIIAGMVAMAIYGISELYITYIHWNFYMVLFASIPMFTFSKYRIGKKGWIKRILLEYET